MVGDVASGFFEEISDLQVKVQAAKVDMGGTREKTMSSEQDSLAEVTAQDLAHFDIPASLISWPSHQIFNSYTSRLNTAIQQRDHMTGCFHRFSFGQGIVGKVRVLFRNFGGDFGSQTSRISRWPNREVSKMFMIHPTKI